MAPTPTTKRRKARTQEQNSTANPLDEYRMSLADDLNARFPDPEPEVKPEDKKDPQVTALLERIARLEEQNRSASEAALAATTVVTPQVITPPGEVSYENLPDPSINPEEYGRELQKRISAHISAQQDYERKISQQNSQQSSQADALWEDFSDQYGEYAGDEERVGFVTQTVLKRVANRGLDPQRYMTTNKDRFFKDIAKEYDKVFGAPEGDENDVDVQPQRHQREPDPANRTAGVFGGTESGSSPAPGRQQQSGIDDFSKELRDFQRKSGYY